MGRSRPFSDRHSADSSGSSAAAPNSNSGNAAPPSVGIELVGFGPGGSDLGTDDSGTPHAPQPSGQTRTLAAVGALLGLALLALFLLNSGANALPERAESPPTTQRADAPSTTLPDAQDPELLQTARDAAEQVLFLEALEPADPSLFEGQVLAWINNDDRLELRALDTGTALPVSALAEHDLPPLPRHVELIGGVNATWLIDLVETENSGKLSNTVRMVRLGADLDSYAFISENDNAPTDFFVGSLWGPSMNGTAQAPQSWTILPVRGAGIVVSSPTAESNAVNGSGLEPLPRHVGRVVAATPDHVAGISCDNRLQCVGVVSLWDGTQQEQIDANALTDAARVRISPDGSMVLSIIDTRWTLYDLEADSYQWWDEGIVADETITWTPDSTAVVWIAEDTLVTSPMVDNEHRASRIGPVGGVSPRLFGTEVAIFDLDAVLEATAVDSTVVEG